MFKISNYITYYLFEPNISQRITAGIIQKIAFLMDFPYMGKRIWKKQERILIFKNYLIFYKIQENQDLIIIMRIMHAKMYHTI